MFAAGRTACLTKLPGKEAPVCNKGHTIKDLGVDDDSAWVCSGKDQPNGCMHGIVGTQLRTV